MYAQLGLNMITLRLSSVLKPMPSFCNIFWLLQPCDDPEHRFSALSLANSTFGKVKINDYNLHSNYTKLQCPFLPTLLICFRKTELQHQFIMKP